MFRQNQPFHTSTCSFKEETSYIEVKCETKPSYIIQHQYQKLTWTSQVLSFSFLIITNMTFPMAKATLLMALNLMMSKRNTLQAQFTIKNVNTQNTGLLHT